MIQNLIDSVGIKNVRFLINMKPIKSLMGFSFTSSSDLDILMLCEIVEDRYKVEDRHKITLQSIEQFKGIRGREHYYISDLEQMIRSGHVQVLVVNYN